MDFDDTRVQSQLLKPVQNRARYVLEQRTKENEEEEEREKEGKMEEERRRKEKEDMRKEVEIMR